MPHASPTHRRWFRFSLGAMVLAVTIVALWLGWDLAFIRERQEWLRDNPGLVLTGGQAEVWRADGSVVRLIRPSAAREPFVPVWRRWLGDAPVAIILDIELTDNQRATVARLFPEAELVPMQRPESGNTTSAETFPGSRHTYRNGIRGRHWSTGESWMVVRQSPVVGSL